MAPSTALLVLSQLLLLCQALPQLLPPLGLPLAADNFRLVAHVPGFPRRDLVPSIENWEVVSSSNSTCDGNAYAILSDGISSGLSFHSDPQTATVKSDNTSRPLSLRLEKRGHGGAIRLSCSQGSPGVGISPVGNGPHLALEQGRQLYACQTELSSTPIVQLFSQGKNSTGIPELCAPVVLYAECADGQHHGDESLATCCFDVKDGKCRVSI